MTASRKPGVFRKLLGRRKATSLKRRRRRAIIEKLGKRVVLSHGNALFNEYFSDGPSSSIWVVRDVCGNSSCPDGGGGAIGRTYVAEFDGTDHELRSTSFDLSNVGSGEISYLVQAQGNEDRPESGDDFLYLQYRRSNGSWYTLETNTIDNSPTTTFASRSVSLPSYAFHSNFALRFYAPDLDGSVDDWFIDDVELFVNYYPTISLSGNSGTRYDDQNSSLSWSTSDQNTCPECSTVSATLVRPGTDLSSSSHSGTYSIPAGSNLGAYTLSVSVTDSGGLNRSASRSITLVDDDDIAPSITVRGTGDALVTSDNGNALVFTDDQLNTLSWEVTDGSGIYDSDVTVKKDLSTFFFSNFSTSGNLSLDDLGVGVFEITIAATDNDTDRGSVDRASTGNVVRRFRVDDDDPNPPEIVFGGSVSNALALVSESHTADNRISWAIADPKSGVASSSVEIRRNGVLVLPATSSLTGSLDLNAMGPGTYQITATATDLDADWVGDAATATVTRTVVVTNTAPVSNPGGNRSAEQGIVTLSGAASSDIDGPLDTLSYAWDFGDGKTGTGSVLTHSYPRQGLYNVALTVTDSLGLATTNSFVLNIVNALPVASPLGLDTNVVDENGSVQLAGSFTDLGLTDTHTVLISWGDGDQSYAVVSQGKGSGSFVATHRYVDDDPTSSSQDDYQVTVKVADNYGGEAFINETVTVRNVAPVFAGLALDLASISEGDTARLTGSFTDVGPGDTHRVRIDWGDGAQSVATVDQLVGSGAFSAQHRYLDNPNSGTEYVITATLTDDDGGTTTASTNISVGNVAPVVDVNALLATRTTDLEFLFSPLAMGAGIDLGAIDENEGIILEGRFVDPSPQDAHIVSIDWGDGTPPKVLNLSKGVETFNAPHQYVDDPSGIGPDVFTVSITVIDDDGDVGPVSTAFVTVNNVAPTAEILSLPDSSPEGTLIQVSSSVTEPSTVDLGNLTYLWRVVEPLETGDVVIATGAGPDFQFTPVDNGELLVELTVSDDDGGTVTINQPISITNVAPVLSGLPSTINVFEAGEVVLVGSILDPSSADTFSLDVDWGEGQIETFDYPAGTTGVVLTHRYADDRPVGQSDTFHVNLNLRDDDEGLFSLIPASDITVNNLPPTLQNVELSMLRAYSDRRVFLEVAKAAAVAARSVSGGPVVSVTAGEVTYTAADTGATLETGSFTSRLSGNQIAIDGADNLDVDLDSPVHSLGFEVFEPSGGIDSSFEVSLKLDGVEVGTIPFNVTNDVPAFVGIRSGSAFNRVEIREVVGDTDDEYFGKFYTGNSIFAEGDEITLTGSIQEPSDLDALLVTIDWGDGSELQDVSVPAGNDRFQQTHRYKDDGPLLIDVSVADDDLGVDSTSIVATIENVNPIPTILSKLRDSTPETADNDQLQVDLVAEVLDAGASDTFTFDWQIEQWAGPRFPTTNSLEFDGTDDFLELPAGLISDQTTVTFEAWFATDSGGVILGYQDAAFPSNPITGSQAAVFIDPVDGLLRAQFADGTNAPLVSSTVVNDGLWRHVALVSDGVEQRLYLDGKLADSRASMVDHGTMDFNQVGSGFVAGQAAPFDGLVDEIRIWNSSRSATDLAASFNVELSGSEPGLVAYYRLEDGTGSSASDSSVAGNDASLGGGNAAAEPAWAESTIKLPVASGLSDTFTFTRELGRTYRVSLKVDDDDGGSTTTTQLFVGGTTGPDKIKLTSLAEDVEVSFDDASIGRFDPGDQIIVNTGAGDDIVEADSALLLPMVLDGGEGNDNLKAGSGSDLLFGADGDDTLDGGAGDDTLVFNAVGSKTATDTGGGLDTLSFSAAEAGVVVDLSGGSTQIINADFGSTLTLIGTFENLFGGEFGDRLTGGTSAHGLIFGGGGNDSIVAGSGADSIDGGDGNDLIFGGLDSSQDTIDGGLGDDSIIGGEGNDLIFGGGGNDTVHSGAGQESILGGDGNDLIFGGFGNDTISGGIGDDTITGGDGNGLIFGGDGNDSIVSGLGSESIDGGSGNDLIFGGFGGADTILGGDGDDSIQGGDGNDLIFGGGDNDTIISGSGHETILGGDGNDLIFGGAGADADTIDAGNGDDSIVGGESNDLIFGGYGNDTIHAGSGTESILGGDGNDLIFGGSSHNDTIDAGNGDDSIVGGEGNDLIFGGSGNDTVSSGSGDETILGGEGNDLIFGGVGSGSDTIDSGGGDDSIFGGDGNDLIFGGSGNDTIDSGGGDASIYGGDGNDLIFGGSAGSNDTIVAGRGDDSVVGGEGNDLIFGGDGNDTITAGTGEETILGGSGNDLIFGGTGAADTVDGGSGDDSIFGGEGNDLIFGGSGNDTIQTGTGNDSILGGDGNDLIFGGIGSGHDTIDGGAGDDSIDGGSGNDLIFGGDGQDTIEAGSGDTSILGGDGNDLIFGGDGIDTIEGNSGDDSIVGGSGLASLIFGGVGNDSIIGGAGTESIHGGDGNDLIFGGEGIVTIHGDAGADTIVGGSGAEGFLFGGDGNDSITSGSASESIDGGSGNDLIFGGEGADTIHGGDGNDSIRGGIGSGGIVYGDSGSDTLVGGGGTETFFGGDELNDDASDVDWLIGQGDYDQTLTDTTLSGLGQVTFDGFEKGGLIGGPGDNLLDASGFSAGAYLSGMGGNDTLIGGSGNDTLVGGTGDDSLVGGLGSDTYSFAGEIDLGSDVVDEPPSNKGDVLDYGKFGSAIQLDLNSVSWQDVSVGHHRLKITSSEGIENVQGSAFADTVKGNVRDNVLIGGGGVDDLAAGDGNDLLAGGVRVVVYLDFDSATDASEHYYTGQEREQIQSRLEVDFEQFDYTFTQSRPTDEAFIHVKFNETPMLNGLPFPGGISDRISWRQIDPRGEVLIDVNAFFGAAIPGTSENFVALSSTIAAHEVLHISGARHFDSFGPIGSGIFDGRVRAGKYELRDVFRPVFPGPTNAEETHNHLIASPASVGTPLLNALEDPFIGERSAIKLSFASTGEVIEEQVNQYKQGRIQLAGIEYPVQLIGELPSLAVPNTILQGKHSGEVFDVDAIDVIGEIGIDAAVVRSESDFYGFNFQAGDVVTFEIYSGSLDRFEDRIDSIIRVYDASGQLIPYHSAQSPGSLAINDDNMESTDSILIDVSIPADGAYIVEVDTFNFRDFFGDDQEGFEGLCGPLTANADATLCTDQDVGQYELFVYRFDSSATTTTAGSGDLLDGGSGDNVFISGPAPNRLVNFYPAENSVEEAAEIVLRPSQIGDKGNLLFSFEQVTGNLGGAEIDPYTGEFHWTPLGSGELQVRFSALDTRFNVISTELVTFRVQNAVPDVSIEQPVAVDEGELVSGRVSFTDPGFDTWTATVDFGDGSIPQNLTILNEDPKEFDLSIFEHVYADDGDFTITVTVTDDEQAQGVGLISNELPVITVRNVLPTVDIADDATVEEGSEFQFLGTLFDAGTLDRHIVTIDWGDGTVEPGFVDEEIDGPPGNPAGLSGEIHGRHTYLDDGAYVITVTLVDDDGGVAEDQMIVTVTNVVPIVNAGSDVTLDEGGRLTGSGFFIDPGADTWTATIDYDDGSGQQTLLLDSVNKTFDLDHTYVEDGIFHVTITVIDDEGGVDTLQVTVNNVAPVVDAGFDLTVAEGSELIQAISFFDPGVTDTQTAAVDWGDGSEVSLLGDVTGGVFDVTHAYRDNGTFTVNVAVSDDDGGVGDDQFTVTVQNVAPTFDAGAKAEANPLALFSRLIQFTDPGADIWNATIDFGDNSTPQQISGLTEREFTLSHVYTTLGEFVVTITVGDDDGDATSGSFVVEITNTQPVLAVPAIGQLEEGTRLLIPASFQDPDTDTWTVTIDYGDGTSFEEIPFGTGMPQAFYLDHHYGNQGDYDLTVTVQDDKGAFDIYSQVVSVTNAVPVLTVPDSLTAHEGMRFDVADLGRVSDGGFDDRPVTYSIDWGDGTSIDAGTSTVDTPGGPGQPLLASFDGGHTYADDGTYSVSVTATDVDGAQTTQTIVVTVENVAPELTLSPAAFDITVDEGTLLSFDTLISIADHGFRNASNPLGASDEWFSFEIDWGDGVAADTGTASIDRVGSPGILTLASFGGSHIYADNGDYRVRVTVTDDDGGVDTAEFGVIVTNVAPTLLPIADQLLTESPNFSLTNLGVFTDPGFTDRDAIEPRTVTVSLGDAIPEGDEGESVTVLVEESFEYTVDWGDGSPLEVGSPTIDVAGGRGILNQGSFDGAHVYDDDGIYTVTVTLADDDGGISTQQFELTILNVAPTVEAGSDQTIDEGQAVTLTSASFNDLERLDTHVATIDWGDGVIESGAISELSMLPPGIAGGVSGTVSGSHIYADNGIYTVTVSVVDDDGASTSDSFTLTVNNVAPSLVVVANQTVNEGATLTLTGLGHFADPGFDNPLNPSGASLETLTYSVDWGDGTSLDRGDGTIQTRGDRGVETSGSFDGAHIYADNGTYTVTVTVQDDDGGSDTQAFQVTVEDVAPTLTVVANQVVAEGAILQLSDLGRLTDPGFDNANGPGGASFESFTYSVDWGDGTNSDLGAATVDVLGGRGIDTEASLDGAHIYADNGTYTVTVTVTDDDGLSDRETFQVAVSNVAPTLTLVSDQAVLEGSTLSLVDLGRFTDPGFDNPNRLDVASVETFTYSVDWGDGTTFDGGNAPIDTFGNRGVLTAGSFDGAHIYADNGTYTVTVTVMDDDGDSDTETFQVVVDNVAPTLTVVSDQTIAEGLPLILPNVGVFTDPGFNNANRPGTASFESFTYSVDWGDGTGSDGGDATVDVGGARGGDTMGSFDAGHIYADDGTYTVTVTIADDDGGVDSKTFQVTVNNVNPVVSVDVPSQQVQYSDSIQTIRFTTTDVPTDAMNATVSYSTDDGMTFLSGLPDGASISGEVRFAGDEDQIANGVWTVSGIADLDPGDYVIRIRVTDEDGGVETAEARIAVAQEDADATYDGPLFVSTDLKDTDTATVPLRVIVRDKTFFDSSSDPEAGNIERALVNFYEVDDAGSWLQDIALGVPVQWIGDDPTIGVANFNWTVGLAKSESAAFRHVRFEVGNSTDALSFYSSTAEELRSIDSGNAEMITVARPNGDFITGGGYLINQQTAGLYTALDGAKTNLGFNVKFNKKLTNLQGKFQARIRTDDGRTLLIRTNSSDSLVVDPTKGVDGGATFVSKANLTDVTDPLQPISLGGGLELIVSMTDNGEPGENDTVSFALWDKKTLLFSSHFDGSRTIEQTISRGNLQVHTDAQALTAGEKTTALTGELLTEGSLQAVVADAIAYWTHSEQMHPAASDLHEVYVGIQDLDGSLLGLASENLGAIWMDRDAGGAGWGANGYDLLSAVTHELGHVLGFDHDQEFGSIMAATLEMGAPAVAASQNVSPPLSRDAFFAAWSQTRQIDEALAQAFRRDGGRKLVLTDLAEPPQPIQPQSINAPAVSPEDADTIFTGMEDDWHYERPSDKAIRFEHSKRLGGTMGE